VTVSKNQHIPQYCGSCWAFSAASAVSDRLRLMTKGAWPEHDLSPQVIVNCDSTSEGCHGGIFIFSTIQIQISLLNCLPHRSHAERLSIHERARCS